MKPGRSYHVNFQGNVPRIEQLFGAVSPGGDRR